jgi:hypothetical protein
MGILNKTGRIMFFLVFISSGKFQADSMPFGWSYDADLNSESLWFITILF